MIIIAVLEVNEPDVLGAPKLKSMYLLCRPAGGLNDTLCQIEQCYKYSETFDRKLIIDTSRSGLFDSFSTYFELKSPDDKTELELTSQFLVILNSCTCFPAELTGRIDAYREYYDEASENYVEKTSSVPLTFDFLMDYKQACLVHHQCGGGSSSIEALSRFKFKADIARQIKEALNSLGHNYDAIHVRNTDVKTEYNEFFATVYKEVVDKRLLVCSDDAACIQYARDFFKNSQVLTVTETPTTKGRALHYNPDYDNPDLNRFDVNRAMFIDLMSLSLAEKLYFTNINRGYVSGFSKLAESLASNKHILLSLLDQCS